VTCRTCILAQICARLPRADPSNGPSRFYVIVSSPTGAAATMSSTYQIERNRGFKEARLQLAVLRERWPLAFPAKDQDLRPLAIGTPSEIAAAMGWSLPYTSACLPAGRWLSLTARPYFAMTNASHLMVRQLK
jgi:hypothetical protein